MDLDRKTCYLGARLFSLLSFYIADVWWLLTSLWVFYCVCISRCRSPSLRHGSIQRLELLVVLIGPETAGRAHYRGITLLVGRSYLLMFLFLLGT